MAIAPLHSWRAASRRLSTLLGFELAMVLMLSGCGAGSSRAPEAPPQPMHAEAAAAPAPPPPPPAVEVAPGSGPPAPAPAAAAVASMHANFKRPGEPEPQSAPSSAPQAAKKGPVQPAKPAPAIVKGAKAAAEPAPHASAPLAPAAPLLIYIGELLMEADAEAIPATIDKVIDIAERLGGYLAGRKDTSVQVRIPSARFRDGFVHIEQVSDVLSRSVTADDVSEQYSDLEVRLVNLKATQKRLHDFLARAGNMADMLNVGRELDRVAGEIEQIEGKMRFLRSRAAFSLITVNLRARPKPIVKVAEKVALPPRDVQLPIDWVQRVGLGRLLNLRSP